MTRRWMIPLFAVACVLLTGTMAWACPGCKEALASNGGGAQGDPATGYFWSILFMMSMPFAVFGTFVSVAYRTVRRAQKLQETDDQQVG